MRLLFLLALIALASASLFHHHHNKRRTFPRHKGRSPARIHVRSERRAEECQKHEHHLICGPEKHCDRTCENLFSPPHCIDHLNHAKCYFPRCVCNAGYVRDDKGICIRASHCPNMYYEPASMIMEDDNEMMIQFKPVKFSRIGHHKVLRIARKSRPHRPSELAIRI
uniref:TIL domain-containing protein n=1 Tax=Caenorhabditis tropicalis TaxID=1561998 RepID=A0A1I7UUA6_9PELO